MAKAQKKQDTTTLTYTGDLDQVLLNEGRYVLPRGEPVEVDAELAKRFADNPYFEAANVPAEDPASTVSADDALAAEREAHQAQLDKLAADHNSALTAQADSLKAGWQEQHDALVAENESLKAQLAAAQTPQQQG